MPDTRLVDETLFDDADGQALRGSVCEHCGTTTFPAQQGCPRCGASAMVATALPTTGRLWSFTVQCFEPKPPYRGLGDFVPYGVGYVDLGPVVVEARLTVSDPDALSIGHPMRLTTIPAFADEDGTVVLTFAFAPDAAAAEEVRA